MKKCKFSSWNNESQNCAITDKKCVYDFLFPDSCDCYQKHKIYPPYCYYNDKIDEIYSYSGYNAININSLHITRNKEGYTINHRKKDKKIYSREELIKKLLEK